MIIIAYLMKCGHVANATTKDNKPACAICSEIRIEKECSGTIGLEERQAICTGHKGGNPKPFPSRWEMPFFEYRPNEKYDAYYCGCFGWD